MSKDFGKRMRKVGRCMQCGGMAYGKSKCHKCEVKQWKREKRRLKERIKADPSLAKPKKPDRATRRASVLGKFSERYRLARSLGYPTELATKVAWRQKEPVVPLDQFDLVKFLEGKANASKYARTPGIVTNPLPPLEPTPAEHYDPMGCWS